MKIYRVKDKYIDHLYKDEPNNKVMFNKPEKHPRPYVGVVLSINEYNYFVPMSSAKEDRGKNLNRRVNTTIKDGDVIVANLKFNNMIPVPKSQLDEPDIKDILIKEPQYGRLLEKERQFVKENSDDVLKKAQSVYTKVVDKKLPFFKNLCIDFKEMEKSHDRFIQQEIQRKRQAILKMRQLER
ncbi:hypothetical protein CON22_17785 [Bacillus cereus]|nr:hypothetical protein CON22_17785 [Bacillus cereus]